MLFVNSTNLKAGRSGVVPPALLDERKIPKFYLDAISQCGATAANKFPDTALVYNLMSRSQLPREVLGNIWSLVNRTLPGRLTRQEFYSCLALIALAQKGKPLSALCNVALLPIPDLQSFEEINAALKTPTTKRQLKKVLETSVPQFFTHLTAVKDSRVVKKNSLVDFDTMIAATKKEVQFSQDLNLMDLSNDVFTAEFPVEGCSTPITNGNVPNFFEYNISFNGFNTTKLIDDSHLPNPLINEKNQQKIATRVSVWRSCLDKLLAIITDTLDLISKNHKYFDEIFETKRGNEFLESLLAMFVVVRRITLSVKTSLAVIKSITASTVPLNVDIKSINNIECIDQLFLQCNLAQEKWNNLEEFFPVRLKKKESFKTDLQNGRSVALHCSVCVQPVDETQSVRIDFVGHTYHAKCANFYLNRVGTLLPQLI